MTTKVCETCLGLSAADLAGVDVTLLRQQDSLSNCTVPASSDILLIQRYLMALRAGTPQEVMKRTMGPHFSPPKIRAGVQGIARGMGIGALVEEADAISAIDLVVNGELMALCTCATYPASSFTC
jgi:hypothetical protein